MILPRTDSAGFEVKGQSGAIDSGEAVADEVFSVIMVSIRGKPV
jgi:hypothetical protein